MPGVNELANLRRTLRPQFERGQTTRGGPLGDDWLKEKWPQVLDAHYQCAVPGPSACLQDALHMITTGKFCITCPGAKGKKEEDVEEPRTLSELDLHLVREWYDKKDKELEETRGEAYITPAACTGLFPYVRTGTGLFPSDPSVSMGTGLFPSVSTGTGPFPSLTSLSTRPTSLTPIE